MAGVVSRRPVVGVAAGSLFGALGILLLGIEDRGGLTRALFILSGVFFLVVGILSLATAIIVIIRSRRA